MTLKTFRICIAAICIAAPALAQDAPLRGSQDRAASFAPGGVETYRLGSGDKVRVIVFGEDDLGGTFDVDGSGIISLPLIGTIKAAGLSAHDLEVKITAALANGYLNDPHVNVEVTTYRPFYVIGEVNKPGEYPYVNDMSVLNAVSLAGGYTERAIESSVCVRRNGDTKEACVDADETLKIYPGDVVRIPVSPFWSVMSIVSPLAGIALLHGY
ncbi:MAG TPA: polysaccharide biosynthesis/export family protein [Rhizomicrobium sp.]|nr:polysaccharide biosynthesis/export family protein [Rhizomicrobium sp.]